MMYHNAIDRRDAPLIALACVQSRSNKTRSPDAEAINGRARARAHAFTRDALENADAGDRESCSARRRRVSM